MRSGKWKVEIQVSTEPTLVYRRFGDKSVARKHAQVAGLLRRARKAAERADAGA